MVAVFRNSKECKTVITLIYLLAYDPRHTHYVQWRVCRGTAFFGFAEQLGQHSFFNSRSDCHIARHRGEKERKTQCDAARDTRPEFCRECVCGRRAACA